MSGQGKNYNFLDKKYLMKRAKIITPKIEGMIESFEKSFDILEGLKKEPYLEFQYLFERSGLTDKLIEKLSKALDRYREMYFTQIGDIQQTSIDSFRGATKP